MSILHLNYVDGLDYYFYGGRQIKSDCSKYICILCSVCSYVQGKYSSELSWVQGQGLKDQFGNPVRESCRENLKEEIIKLET